MYALDEYQGVKVNVDLGSSGECCNVTFISSDGIDSNIVLTFTFSFDELNDICTLMKNRIDRVNNQRNNHGI